MLGHGGVGVAWADRMEQLWVVACGTYLHAIADLITGLVLWEAFCSILAQKSAAFLSFVARAAI